MDQSVQSAYDTAACARVWQRVAPELTPYAGAAEQTLPGALADPCCMGTQAQTSVEVLRGFVRAELADRRGYAALSRVAPTAEARRTLRAMAQEEGGHARRLLGVLYLITGEVYRPVPGPAVPPEGGFCPLLRRLYHEEACSAFNYRRASSEAQDDCLRAIFAALADDEQRHADALLTMLERMMPL